MIAKVFSILEAKFSVLSSGYFAVCVYEGWLEEITNSVNNPLSKRDCWIFENAYPSFCQNGAFANPSKCSKMLELEFPGLQDSKEKFKFGGCIFAKLLYPQIARVGNAFSRRMRNPIKTSPLRRVRGLGLGRGEDLNIEWLPFAQSPASFVTKHHSFLF